MTTTAWQATRSLTSEDGRPVEVSLGSPELAGERWQCAVQFVVDGTSTVTQMQGEDAFGALQMALTFIWHEANALGCKQRADFPPKSHGFDRLVPIDPLIYDVDGFNAMLDKRLEDMDATPEGVAAAKALGRALMAKGRPPPRSEEGESEP